ncbi:unnamed protein product [Timema podura]|uniref:Uncharacterized protein n=1 Tax=Timema podura TaxID=61482 RepID=A0ABN7PNJ3_TIMPD|nr:unnamed protein product [Timema podura]
MCSWSLMEQAKWGLLICGTPRSPQDGASVTIVQSGLFRGIHLTRSTL